MRISDWSSDVCSSDLPGVGGVLVHQAGLAQRGPRQGNRQAFAAFEHMLIEHIDGAHDSNMTALDPREQPVDQIGPRIEPALDELPLEQGRSEEHTSELQSLMRTSYAVFCMKKTKINKSSHHIHI